MIKTYPTMYARDAKGKILQWVIEVLSNGNTVDIKKTYGEKNGAQALKWQRNIQGKNEGKANETNAWEQAQKQAESAINLKRRGGYTTVQDLLINNNNSENTIFNIDTILDKYLPYTNTNAEGNLIPMKAQQYYRKKPNWTAPDGTFWKDRKYYYMENPYAEKEKSAIIAKFPTLIQPKINGVRCFVQLENGVVKMYSKKGTNYKVPHILDYFNMNIDLFGKNGDIVFDGELYIHNESLQNIGSAVDKFNFDTSRLVYVIFDLAIPIKTNMQRLIMLKDMQKIFDATLSCPVQRIKTLKVNSDAIVQNLTDSFIKDGYEGSILRNPEAVYQFGKRPQDMTKLKRLMDEEFKIVAIVPQEKDKSLGLYVCITKNGDEVRVTPTGTDAFKREILINKHNYIGKELTCSFYEYTDKGLPFHIVNSTIRNYE